MRTIGLTGGIGSGKSTVAQQLQKLGAVVVDSDRAAHETYRPHSAGWHKLVAAFGPDLLLPSGEIDRKRLGTIVFADTAALAKLNAIVHPLVRESLEQTIQEHRRKGTRVLVVEVPLLYETGFEKLVDEVWVTCVPEEVAVRRLAGRNGLTEEAARSRIKAQLASEERERRADVVIDTDVDLKQLERNVQALWDQRIVAKGRA